MIYKWLVGEAGLSVFDSVTFARRPAGRIWRHAGRGGAGGCLAKGTNAAGPPGDPAQAKVVRVMHQPSSSGLPHLKQVGRDQRPGGRMGAAAPQICPGQNLKRRRSHQGGGNPRVTKLGMMIRMWAVSSAPADRSPGREKARVSLSGILAHARTGIPDPGKTSQAGVRRIDRTPGIKAVGGFVDHRKIHNVYPCY